VTDPVNEPRTDGADRSAVDSARRYRLSPVLALGLAVRVLLLVAAFFYTRDPGVFHVNDTGSYLVLAQSLLRHGRFGIDTTPDITRTPGYPLLLIPGLAVGRMELITLALQIALSMLSVYLVFRLAHLLCGRQDVAWWAALLYALEPLSVIYASKLLSETLFTTLVIAACCGLVAYVRRPAWRRMFLVAVGLAAAAYVRPIAYYLPVVVALCLTAVAVRRRTYHPPGPMLGSVALLLVVAMGLTGVWRARNWVEAGYPGFAAVSDVNLYFYLGASVRAAREGVPYYEMQRRMGYYDHTLYLRLHPEQTTWSPARRLTHMGTEGRRMLLDAPLTYARIHLDGIVRLLVAPGATDALRLFDLDRGIAGYLGVFVDEGVSRGIATLSRTLPFVFWSNLVLAPMLVASLACAGLAMGCRSLRRDAASFVLLGVMGYLVVIAGGPAAYARFRHPIMPIVCVYAACGVAWLRLHILTTKLTTAAGTASVGLDAR
jgi:4-amino-4-deoxy-L-arabinose transferase-like glycosyltransferase